MEAKRGLLQGSGYESLQGSRQKAPPPRLVRPSWNWRRSGRDRRSIWNVRFPRRAWEHSESARFGPAPTGLAAAAANERDSTEPRGDYRQYRAYDRMATRKRLQTDAGSWKGRASGETPAVIAGDPEMSYRRRVHRHHRAPAAGVQETGHSDPDSQPSQAFARRSIPSPHAGHVTRRH